MLGRALGRETHRLVVVHIHDLGLGPLGADRLQALDRRALGHVDHGLLLELAGHPGHAAAMVAVGGGGEDHFAEARAHRVADHHFIRQLADVLPQPLGDVPGHGVRAAKRLEGLEAETLRFVLDVDAAHAQVRREAIQGGERRRCIAGNRAVERQRPGELGWRKLGHRSRRGLGKGGFVEKQIQLVRHVSFLVLS